MLTLILWFFSIWSWFSSLFSSGAIPIPPDIIQNQMDIIINTNINNHIYDLDFVDYVNGQLLLDCISPVFNYDMDRYVDAAFIEARPFLTTNYLNFSSFIENLIVNHGAKMDMTPYQSHMMFFFSTLKKMYVLSAPNSALSPLDYYILDWAKIHISLSDHGDYINIVVANPQIQCIDFVWLK